MPAGVCGRLDGVVGAAGPAHRIIDALTAPAVQAVERLGQAFPGQRAHVGGVGLLEKLCDVAGGERVVDQTRFQALQAERR